MTSTTRLIPERQQPGRRLGRHVRHDPRSLRFQVRPRAHAARSVQWSRVTPVLDQGELGSCTGNAAAGCLGTVPFVDTVPASLVLDEREAVALYSTATRLDDAPGAYPPDDTGSDGLSVAKAAQRAGLIAGYRHCTSVDAVITALQTGPVITGVNWYDGFDTPNAVGRVAIAGSVRGGHEFELLGVDLDFGLLHAVNSWGTSWGLGGHFYITLADYERLLAEQGDATAFVPLGQPAPTPSPAPVPRDQADVDLVTALDPWELAPHSYHLATVASRGYAQWKSVRGY